MDDPKERPILFSAPMVRAVLAGTKSQTRRALKFQPYGVAEVASGNHLFDFRTGDLSDYTDVIDMRGLLLRCPHGQPGDRLWVRENGWERPERTPKMMREGADTWVPYYYDADGITPQEVADFKAWGLKRRPSIHMPRWASRLALDVTGVRLERLNSISDADCVAEGAPGGHGAITGYRYNATPREHYTHVWTTINGKESWAANPWVWVIEFRRSAVPAGVGGSDAS
jgi:hypothetical protein